MATKIFDFLCAECAHTFEAFVRDGDAGRHCPRCNSIRVARQPVLSLALKSHSMRRGRVLDMSSNSCPCGCATGKHAHRAARPAS